MKNRLNSNRFLLHQPEQDIQDRDQHAEIDNAENNRQ